jgi:hypothetical protein
VAHPSVHKPHESQRHQPPRPPLPPDSESLGGAAAELGTAEMEEDAGRGAGGGDRLSFVIGLIENRAKEVTH